MALRYLRGGLAIVSVVAVLLAALFLGLATATGIVPGYLAIWFSDTAASRVRPWVEAELPIGATASEIEAFYQRHGIEYFRDDEGFTGVLFDAFWSNHNTRISIDVDDEDRVKAIRIRDQVQTL